MASSPEHPQSLSYGSNSFGGKEEIFYNDPNLIYTDLYSWLDRVLLPNDPTFASQVLSIRKEQAKGSSTKKKTQILSNLLTSTSLVNKRKEKKTKAKGNKKQKLHSSSTPSSIWAMIIGQVKERYLTRAEVVNIAQGNARKISSLAMREVRRTLSSSLSISDPMGVQKKSMRDVLSFWRKNEREEKELRRKAEKLAMEQRRAEEEAREARRQARKLDFLINQTELYAHFMARKFGSEATDSLPNEPTSNHDPLIGKTPSTTAPGMLHCTLKPYQLRGLSWLASLYDQGINGILADEMGLGKTVQSIALLAHVAERHGIWGPFLIVTPASTLHNWMDELARFVPSFNPLPYWGPDRRSLLKASSQSQSQKFHILVTSYQIVVSDERTLSRIPWQYMVLDEAQAIKSSASVRWKTLLGIPARNRLLLTGTPIQNTMAELWALLHFIMPGLFDSHDEFASWFSKDIEESSNVKGSSSFGGDPFQLRRLHAILRPFMLRRLKRDVEMELEDKIEIDILIPASPVQKTLMERLRASLRLSSSVSLLKNVAMQARKLCNHPELLLPSEIQAPLLFPAPSTLTLPGTVSQFISKPACLSQQSSWKKLSNQSSILLCHSGLDRKNFFFGLNKKDPLIPKLTPLETVRAMEENTQLEPFHNITINIPRLAKVAWVAPVIAPIPGLVYSGKCGGYTPPQLKVLMSPFTPFIPAAKDRIAASGKMAALVTLLSQFKSEGHRILIYFQMTRMMDIAEEIFSSLSYSFIRLDGTCRIEDRRDMVYAWQNTPSLFIFLLSTRAGGLGINLTAADTVIFYDSDWNPTVDQQAMDVRNCPTYFLFLELFLFLLCFYYLEYFILQFPLTPFLLI